jgi:hypothetical protein
MLPDGSKRFCNHPTSGVVRQYSDTTFGPRQSLIPQAFWGSENSSPWPKLIAPKIVAGGQQRRVLVRRAAARGVLAVGAPERGFHQLGTFERPGNQGSNERRFASSGALALGNCNVSTIPHIWLGAGEPRYGRDDGSQIIVGNAPNGATLGPSMQRPGAMAQLVIIAKHGGDRVQARMQPLQQLAASLNLSEMLSVRIMASPPLCVTRQAVVLGVNVKVLRICNGFRRLWYQDIEGI